VEKGDASKESVVFLHGSPLSSRSWSPQLEDAALSSSYHLLAPDLPRHGNSANIDAISIENVVNHVADLIVNHSRHKRAHLVGASPQFFVCVPGDLHFLRL